MTNLNDTGESVPAYHIDHTLYEGRPADTSGREEKEIRTYDLLDSLQVPYVRVDHDALPTIEACREVDQLLGTEICKNLSCAMPRKPIFTCCSCRAIKSSRQPSCPNRLEAPACPLGKRNLWNPSWISLQAPFQSWV